MPQATEVPIESLVDISPIEGPHSGANLTAGPSKVGLSTEGAAIAHKEPHPGRAIRGRNMPGPSSRGTRQSARLKAQGNVDSVVTEPVPVVTDLVPMVQQGLEPEAEESDDNWLIKF